MSTAYEKEMAASTLRVYADRTETALDSIPALSADAWDCPAADAFVEGVVAEQGSLAAAAGTMRSIANALDAAAAAQRAAEAAAAAAAEAAAAEAAAETAAASEPADPPPIPMNVF